MPPPGHPDRDYWSAPPIWQGETCYIVGGGPSVKAIDVERLRDARVIAVNEAYKLGDWIPALFFGDCRWYMWNKSRLLNWGGLKVTCCRTAINQPGIKRMRKVNHPRGLETRRDSLKWNWSSGAAAINLAVHFGVSRIVLLGFDMKTEGKATHWHDAYTHDPKRNPYKRFLKGFPDIAAALGGLRVECVNACPGSALPDFPIVEPDDVLPPPIPPPAEEGRADADSSLCTP